MGVLLQIIKDCDLEELQELGSGTFGTVYHGKWRGSDVAIKRINDRCFAGKPSEQERMVCILLLKLRVCLMGKALHGKPEKYVLYHLLPVY